MINEDIDSKFIFFFFYKTLIAYWGNELYVMHKLGLEIDVRYLWNNKYWNMIHKTSDILI